MSDIRTAIVSWDNVAPNAANLILRPEGNLRTGIGNFADVFPSPTSLEEDVLVVASTIYACDLAFKRGERENITRSIEVTLPVVNYQAFQRLKPELETILWVLSHDAWSFTFQRRQGVPEASLSWASASGKTLLFSGGLDSFAGAVDLLDEIGVNGVQLSSHVTANPATISSQKGLISYLESQYGSSLRRIVVRTGGHNIDGLPFPDQDREETQRTRSFMFLAIAALAARRSGHSEVVMIAENGQMAIHLPLSAARIGAFSTHTAHPEFVHRIGQYFSDLLDYAVRVTNPYLYSTKAEVVQKLVSRYPDAIPTSVSCWKSSRIKNAAKHCGECIPCLTRRVALESNGLKLSEYNRDLLSEDAASLPPDDEGKRNLIDFVEFAHVFQTLNDAELEYEYPELINEQIDRAKAVSMYRRMAREVWNVFSAYPGMIKLMPSPPTGTVVPAAKPHPKSTRKKRL
jgi:hypothetical protein